MLFGGSNGGPQGPRWLIHGPSPHVKLVERRKGTFGSLERVLLVLTFLESGLEKRARFGGKYCLGAPMRSIWQFGESITGPYSLGKRLRKTGSFQG